MNLLLTEGTNGSSWLIPIIIVGLLAFMIVPQIFRSKKENAKRQEVMSSLKVGDSIITNAYVFGKILSMRETTIGRVFVIETGDDKHKSYQEVHEDAIIGIDTKRDIVLDADGNDITFAEEDKLEQQQNKVENLPETKINEEINSTDEIDMLEVKEAKKPTKAKKSTK